MKKSTLLLAASFAVMSLSAASADVIISDTFTGTDGASNDGRTPDVNLPGASYVNQDYFTQATSHLSGNTLQMSANDVTSISIASTGSYTEPTSFKVSADLQVGNSSGAPGLTEAFVGFFATRPGYSNANHEGTNNGLDAVGLDGSGNLILKTFNSSDATTAGETITDIASYNATALGTFSATSFYNLSYIVNGTTGDISAITLKSSTGSITYDVATTAFTSANLNYLALTSGANDGGAIGYADNLTLSTVAVPEPGTWAMLLGGMLTLVAVRLRRSRS